MSRNTARKLASHVARTSNGVSIKFGRTNGRAILHLIRRRDDEHNVTAASDTIRNPVEWELHPWNAKSIYR